MIYTGSADAFRKYTSPETFAGIVDDGDLCRMWQRCAKAYAERTAVVYDGASVTFAGLDSQAAGLRGAVAAAGCGLQDRVAVLCGNSIDFVRAFLAVVTAGCTAVVLPPHLDAGAVYGCCRLFGVKALVCQEALLPKCEVLKTQAPDIPVLTPDSAAAEAVSVREVSSADPCVIMFTGGTTGKSKGALLSHAAVTQGVMNGCYGIREIFGQRYLLALPLSHVFGLIRNLLTSLYTGSTLMICKSNQDLFRDIASFRPTVLVLVPALAEMALALSRKFGRNMLGADMRTVICGAAAVPQFLVEEYSKLGIDLFPGYGLTESANLVSGNPEPMNKPGSVGLPFPNQELRLVDGELWLRGRNMLTAYVGTEEKAWTEDQWFRTGDLARVDEDGFLYITGRTKEIIILDNAENISPAELEARFNELPCIQDSQVFEAAAEDGKHILALEVVLRASEAAKLGDDPKGTALQMLWEINRRQRPAEQVARIVIRDQDFERSPSMKIVRYKR